MEKPTCHLFDLMSLNKEQPFIYTKPVYTKFNSVYGYITVSGNEVFFFYVCNSSGVITFDNVSDKFRVEYI